jgi:hypothetical protein
MRASCNIIVLICSEAQSLTELATQVHNVPLDQKKCSTFLPRPFGVIYWEGIVYPNKCGGKPRDKMHTTRISEKCSVRKQMGLGRKFVDPD